MGLFAVSCTLHGLGEHGGQYELVARILGESGFAVTAPDHRGHGRSDGKRGHTPSYETLLDDVDALVQDVAERHPGVPCFLYGHSLGGNIALNYGIQRAPGLAGIIATNPWLRLVNGPGALKRWFAGLMEPFLPQMTFPTSDEDLVKESDLESIDKDAAMTGDGYPVKLFHNRVSLRMYVAVSRAGDWALANADKLSVPSLIVHGEQDPVTDHRASIYFADQTKGICDVDIRPGMYHNVHAEEYGPQVVKRIGEWIESRVPGPA
jgi:alpha-beta hydrolase superfamily lysophospholipase